jgi:hypothetical protein
MRSPVTDDGCPSPPWACRGLQARRLRLGAGLSVPAAYQAPWGPRLPISRKRSTTVRIPHQIRPPLHLHGVSRSVPRRCVRSAAEVIPAQVTKSPLSRVLGGQIALDLTVTKHCSQSSPSVVVTDMFWLLLGEGFNWSEALRTRAERAPSFGNFYSTSPQAQQPAAAISQGYHQRAASVSIVEEPTREMPRQPRQNKPDFFQEKILRADFMD